MKQSLLLLSAAATLSSAATQKPHIIMHLVDDWGWANAGWHQQGNPEVYTPNMDQLVKEGIELDRAYSYQFCSPTRSSFQSGRNPLHVNDKNMDITVYNKDDPVSGFAGIPRNMTGIAQKMRDGGYRTHQIGKWDAGWATLDHIPTGRGYDTSFGYAHHDNDYWDDTVGPLVDLWDTDGPAFGMNSSCLEYYNGSHGCAQPGTAVKYTVGPESLYEERLFVDRIVTLIDAHPDDPDHPLFINYDSHIVHSPLQAPQDLFERFDFMQEKDDWDRHRQIYAAMVAYLDSGVGRIVDAMKGRGFWDNTLWVCQSDNGGPSFTGDNHTANNYPLRGAKYSNWEGGVRVNAFVSGGYLKTAAPKRIGSKLEGFVHVSDYYTTFSRIAGVNETDERAAAADLPPVDGLDLWPYISGQVDSSPRDEVWNDIGVLIMGQYKLYNSSGPYGSLGPDGNALQMYGCRPGPSFPNGSTDYHGPGWSTNPNGVTRCIGQQSCPNGVCLYNIFEDPTEQENLSGDPSMKPQITKMLSRLQELEATYFNPDRGHDDGLAVRTAWDKWQGYWGPFVFP